MDKPTHGQLNRGLINSWTSELADCMICSLVNSSSSSHSQRGPSRRSSIMTASKGLSPEVGSRLAGVSDLVDPSATWATRPTTPGGIRKTTK